MAIQLLCDTCTLIIQDGTERYDVSVPTRTDPASRQRLPGSRFNFHPTCYTGAGAVTPVAGLTVTVTHVAAAPPPPDTTTSPTNPGSDPASPALAAA